MSARPKYSIVAPVYNEVGNLRRFYTEVAKALESIGASWELIIVNDGSSDGSHELMIELAEQDSRVRVISFARNFGHQIAVTAGVDYASGDAIILIDADLQDPPAVIPRLIAKWKDGYEVVYAVRAERKGESFWKRISAKIFYRLIHRITDINIPVDTGDFRLMDARVARVLRQMREHHRFIRGMTSWVGYKQTGVEYVREQRVWGETKYPLGKMIAFALDAVTSFSFFPLQIMIYISLVLAMLSLAGGFGDFRAAPDHGRRILRRAGDHDCFAAAAEFVSAVLPVRHRPICRANLRRIARPTALCSRIDSRLGRCAGGEPTHHCQGGSE